MSQKVYCIAMFRAKCGQEDALFKVLQSLEPNAHREDGCIQYLVTRHIKSDFATGESFPIVFNEIWKDKAAFEAHCQRKEIVEFFEQQCVAEDGLVEAHNVCVYSDQANHYDAPIL
ncbi:antibiotic biosynthesis monooxygenase [Psychromonas sp. RZ22]|uniref:putative quinol monooxygenase n=1 Tax=Psychromonas algarum TaxID=2555643 RepID=UPI0010685DA8|nr:antibiotic biosynthesis monooxygenase [Psychromonas sp. RZ22]TEW56121.1 antibiotic biosynthesis monooxygenase [Psychromonas sp. RZ22]